MKLYDPRCQALAAEFLSFYEMTPRTHTTPEQLRELLTDALASEIQDAIDGFLCEEEDMKHIREAVQS